MYVENDLYNFLNHSSNLRGRIILGIYKKTRKIDRIGLVDLIVMKNIGNELNNFS